jgi:hypothetical protein
METPHAIQHSFEDEFFKLYDANEKEAYAYFNSMGKEEVQELGRLAARTIFAPLIWSAQVGDRWDVRRSCEFLGMSRQALYKRVRTGTALGVQGQGTTYFPTWQFDLDKHLIRHVTSEIIGAFREADDQINPLVIAAWATKPSADLDGVAPADWVSRGGEDRRVVVAARRAAAGLAQ